MAARDTPRPDAGAGSGLRGDGVGRDTPALGPFIETDDRRAVRTTAHTHIERRDASHRRSDKVSGTKQELGTVREKRLRVDGGEIPPRRSSINTAKLHDLHEHSECFLERITTATVAGGLFVPTGQGAGLGSAGLASDRTSRSDAAGLYPRWSRLIHGPFGRDRFCLWHGSLTREGHTGQRPVPQAKAKSDATNRTVYEYSRPIKSECDAGGRSRPRRGHHRPAFRELTCRRPATSRASDCRPRPSA